MHDRIRPAGRPLEVKKRQQQGQREVREHAVHGGEQQHPLRDLPFGAQLLGHHHYHRRRGRGADGRRRRREQRPEAEPGEGGVDRREAEQALGERRDEEPAVAPQPAEVEAKAELEDDQADGKIDEQPRLEQRIGGKEVARLRAEQHAGEDVAGDARQSGVAAHRFACGEAQHQQRTEQHRLRQRDGQLGEEIRRHAPSAARLPVSARP
jgi:hypothetical protein